MYEKQFNFLSIVDQYYCNNKNKNLKKHFRLFVIAIIIIIIVVVLK